MNSVLQQLWREGMVNPFILPLFPVSSIPLMPDALEHMRDFLEG